MSLTGIIKQERFWPRSQRRGVLYTFKSGRKIFLFDKGLKNIFRMDAKSIAAAVREETAFWGLDLEALVKMRSKGCAVVGVRVKETGDIYLAEIAAFFDERRARVAHRFAKQHFRYLAIKHFRLRPGVAKV